MKRILPWIGWGLGLLLGLPLLVLILLLVLANSQKGCDWVERTIADTSGGQVSLTGLSGHLPDGLRLARLELRDKAGAWLVIEELALDWSPLRLLAGEASIDRLEVGHIVLDRLPPPSSEKKPSAVGFSLPVAIRLQSVRVDRLDLGQALAGKPASVRLTGQGHLASLTRGEVTLSVQRLDGPGVYTLQGRYEDTKVQAKVSVEEPARGMIASFAGIEELDALSMDAEAAGPLSALQTRLTLAFGPLRAIAQGRLDFDGRRIDELALSVTAPAMQPRPDLSWQAIAVEAQASGPFTAPTAQGTLHIDHLSAAGATVRAISFHLQGDAGQVGLDGEIAGVRLPGPQPDLLEAAPVTLQADLRLDAADRPLQFHWRHPLFTAAGKATLGGDLKGDMALNLPDLQPFAALGRQDLRGKADLNLHLARGAATTLAADGLLSVTGGSTPWPKLLGDQARLAVAVTLNGSDLTLSRLNLEGNALALSAAGALVAGQADVQWKFSLSDLAVVMADGSGRLAAQGRVNGPLDNLAVHAELNGELATKGLPRGPINAQIALTGLPHQPVGQVTARGVLGGSPVDLVLTAQAPADGSVQVNLERANWKSTHGMGSLHLSKGAEWPLGKIELHMGQLTDLRPWLGHPVQGNLSVNLETIQRAGRPQALLTLEAHNAGLVGTATVGQTRLTLAVSDPIHQPVLDGRLDLAEIAAGAVKGGSRLDLAGPLTALGLHLSAEVRTAAGETHMETEAKLDAPNRRLALTRMEAGWKGETLRLLEPAHLDFAEGLAVGRLRLGFGEAVLELTGRTHPRLDLTASLRNVSAALARLFDPTLDAAGTLRADAHVTDNPAHPSGLMELEAEGLRMRTGPGRGLPPAELTAKARLDGTMAHIDTHLSSGRELDLNLSGEVPLTAAGLFDLHAWGGVDLKLLNPLLAADGRLARGQLALDASLVGPRSEPRMAGTARLSGGEARDLSSGVQLSDIEALWEAQDGTIRLVTLAAKAGPGKITASGTVDLSKEGLPVDFTLAADNARPLASDRLTVYLDSDLRLRGQLQGSLAASGTVHLRTAEIRIPERLPTSIAVLKVRRSGDTPPLPAPPATQRDITLDLRIDAPRQIYVRGRGLEAELGGTIQVRGSTARPQPEGVFTLRRGQFTLAGKRLIFNKGEVGFDGGSITDPSLNFLAKTTSGNVTANLAVGGTAGKPKLTLSSVPELPQDEVLAQLLFSRSTSKLSPLELTQIASALASLSGVTSGIGDPLESVRKGFGLDRLSVGATMEAGRYIAPGVYVGAKQGISGGNSQATVQIDITKSLKLEGSVGTGASSSGSAGSSGANSVGVIYQYEY
ncbi:translocation and assembly module TamB [Gammaproteobacteria bacterium]